MSEKKAAPAEKKPAETAKKEENPAPESVKLADAKQNKPQPKE